MSPLPFLALGVLSLFSGIWAGLLRLPLPLPHLQPALAASHGPLMIGAFLGAVISAERASALGGRAAWWPALFCGAGGVLLLIGPLFMNPASAWHLAFFMMLLGGLGLVWLFSRILQLQSNLPNQVMAAAAVALALGNLVLWRSQASSAALPWWSAFLVLTIAGERLELNRLLKPSRRAGQAFRGVIVLLLLAPPLSLLSLEFAQRLQGLGHLLLALWLFQNDIAKRTVHIAGAPRYAAVCLLSGYAWLAIAGLLGLAGPFETAGLWRDAFIHSQYLGFVFAMIFGHAPIMVPALTGVAVRFSNTFYLPLLVLHAGLLLRVAGDVSGNLAARQAGGVGNALAILLFLGVLLGSLERSKPDKASHP